MTPLLIGFLVVVGAVLQGLLPSVPFLGQAKPPVLLGIVLYFALMRNSAPALSTAVVAGLFLDLLGQGRLGFSILCFLIIAWVVNESREHLFGRRWSTHMMLGVFGSAFMVLALYLLNVMDGSLRLPFTGMLAKAYGTMLLGLITVPIVFKVVDWMHRGLGIRVKVRQQ